MALKSVKVLAALLVLQHPLVVRYGIVAGSFIVAPAAVAQSESEEFADLTMAGWQRDTDLVSMKIDRYRSASGAFDLNLMAFPETDLSASDWIDALIPILAKESGKPDNPFHIVSAEDTSASMLKDGEDAATRQIMVVRPGAFCF